MADSSLSFRLGNPAANRQFQFSGSMEPAVKFTEKHRPARLADVIGQGQVDAELPKADVLLIGPQMRMMKKKMEAKGKELGIPVDIIPPVLYGRCDGQKILDLATKLVEDEKK